MDAEEDALRGWPFSKFLTKFAKGGDPSPCKLAVSRNRGSTEEQEKEAFEVQRGTEQTLDIDAEKTSIQEPLLLASMRQKLFLEVK